MLPSTVERVAKNTPAAINNEIRRATEARIAQVAKHGPRAIHARPFELDQGGDIERCLETMAPSLTLAGLTLGLTVNRKWLLLPIAVQVFFLQHALQGWCPPVPLLRKLGI